MDFKPYILWVKIKLLVITTINSLINYYSYLVKLQNRPEFNVKYIHIFSAGQEVIYPTEQDEWEKGDDIKPMSQQTVDSIIRKARKGKKKRQSTDDEPKKEEEMDEGKNEEEEANEEKLEKKSEKKAKRKRKHTQ